MSGSLIWWQHFPMVLSPSLPNRCRDRPQELGFRHPCVEAYKGREVVQSLLNEASLLSRPGEPHIYNHGILEDEVEDVILRPGEDRIGREGARVAIGQAQSGRYLRVIYVPDPEPERIFVITAYELRGKPRTAYRRRQRRKGQR